MSELSAGKSGADRITADDVETQGPTLDPKYTDEGAIKLVTGDAERAKNFLELKQWNLHWREADILYQSPRTAGQFEGSTVARANVSRFTVAKHVNSLVPGMQEGIFYEKPPFVMRPRPAQKQSTINAKSALYDALLDEIHFQQTCTVGMEYQVNTGTVIFQGGWETIKETKRRYIRKTAPVTVQMPLTNKEVEIHTKESDEFEIKDIEVTKNRPFFERCELGEVLVDPGWRDPNEIQKAKFVIRRTYPTFRDLNKLRQNPEYDIPSDEELKAYFFAHEADAHAPSSIEAQQGMNSAVHHAENRNVVTTDDPLDRPLECLERWTSTYVHTILNVESGQSVVIRNKAHTFDRIPFFSANFWNIPNAAYGMGVGRLAGSDQRIEKGLVDAVLDILSFAVNPQYMRDRGANAPTQQIRQRLGGIIDVDTSPGKSIRDAFALVELPKVPPEAFAVLQNAQTNAQSTTGADEAFTQGSLPGKGGSSAARTATGAGGIIAANAGKLQGPVGHFVDGVLLPFIEMLDDMVKQQMPAAEIREILGKELGEAFEFDMGDFLNAEHSFEVLAGAHLAAKKAMAQSLPLMIQILENPHLVQQLNAMGYAVDVKQIFEMFMEMSGWKNTREVIRPMTPKEQQSFQNANPGAQKMQTTLATIGAKHQAKAAEIDQEGEAKLAHDMMLNAGEEAAAYTERKEMRNYEQQGVFTQ